MAELATLKLKDIFIPERLRAVEEEHALAISTDMAAHGQITPIMVRRTPNGKQKYTLVAGAHRCRAIELYEGDEVDAVIAVADKQDAQLLEISENLFRNDLSVIDRAVFVQTYRDLWEQKHGTINSKGGRPKKQVQLAPVSDAAAQNPLDLIEEEASKGFAVHVAKRLGVSKDVVKKLNRIGQMDRRLREALRGTASADNAGLLYKLSGFDPDDQHKAVVAIAEMDGDIKRALAIVHPAPPKPNKQEAVYNTLLGTWGRASKETKAKFLAFIQGDAS